MSFAKNMANNSVALVDINDYEDIEKYVYAQPNFIRTTTPTDGPFSQFSILGVKNHRENVLRNVIKLLNWVKCDESL